MEGHEKDEGAPKHRCREAGVGDGGGGRSEGERGRPLVLLGVQGASLDNVFHASEADNDDRDVVSSGLVLQPQVVSLRTDSQSCLLGVVVRRNLSRAEE